MLKIIQNLEALTKGAATHDESELLRASTELTKMGVPPSLQNKCIRMGCADNNIECLRSTIIFELRVDQIIYN